MDATDSKRKYSLDEIAGILYNSTFNLLCPANKVQVRFIEKWGQCPDEVVESYRNTYLQESGFSVCNAHFDNTGEFMKLVSHKDVYSVDIGHRHITYSVNLPTALIPKTQYKYKYLAYVVQQEAVRSEQELFLSLMFPRLKTFYKTGPILKEFSKDSGIRTCSDFSGVKKLYTSEMDGYLVQFVLDKSSVDYGMRVDSERKTCGNVHTLVGTFPGGSLLEDKELIMDWVGENKDTIIDSAKLTMSYELLELRKKFTTLNSSQLFKRMKLLYSRLSCSRITVINNGRDIELILNEKLSD